MGKMTCSASYNIKFFFLLKKISFFIQIDNNIILEKDFYVKRFKDRISKS